MANADIADLELAVLLAKFDPSQPRDREGRWTEVPGLDASTTVASMYEGHAGTPDDPVPCGSDIERAAVILGDGGNVTLDQPNEVATLLAELRDLVADAEAKGEKAPTYDLCKVSVPGTNLFCQDNVTRPDGTKVDRIQMPQLSTKDPKPGSFADKQPRNKKGEVDLSRQFGEFLASSGRETTNTTIDASHLRASQNELDGGKVAGIAGAVAAGKIDVNDPKGAIYVTRDNYVIDGHHRWAAYVAEQIRTDEVIDMPVIVVDMDIGTALTTANFWTEEMGIPPADVTKKARTLDPYLARTLARTPELLDVIQKFSEPKDRGDASGLIRWFNAGADGAIAWGTPGDWAQCVAIASAHMGVEDAHGFCQNRHIEATGMSTAEHAHNEGKADFNPSLHPRDSEGQFTETPGGGTPLAEPASAGHWAAEPHERLTALSGAWSDWQRAGITEKTSDEIRALGDPRLEVTGYAGSILGGDPVAARWKGDHVEITAEGWDRSEPDSREFLLAHEMSHAAAADFLANNDEHSDILVPFRNTEGGTTFSERALVFPGEFDNFARGPEEMLSDIGATLTLFGRNVLQDRFEAEKEFDISPTPPDPRLVRVYDAMAEALDRVGNPPPRTKPQKAFTETLHPRYPAGTPGGLGGQFMPESGALDAYEQNEANDAKLRQANEEALNAAGMHVGDLVHYVVVPQYYNPNGPSRPGAPEYYVATIDHVGADGIHLFVPKDQPANYGADADNPDRLKQISEIAPTNAAPALPPGVSPVEIHTTFGSRYLFGNALFEETSHGMERISILSEAEVGGAIRQSAAEAGDFHEGDLVVTSDGDVGTLMRMGTDRGDDTATIRLSSGDVYADIMPKQHAGTWETPPGWTAAGSTAGLQAREVFTAYDGGIDRVQGRARVYAINYPAEWKQDDPRIAKLRTAVEYSIGQNHAMEKDSGLTNRWNGTIKYDTMRDHVAAYKDWNCDIAIGSFVLGDLPESEEGLHLGRNPYQLNPKDIEDSTGVLSHELAHGLSQTLSTTSYEGHKIPLEEGVAEAYREAFMTVQARGRSAPSPLEIGSAGFPPGYQSYNAYVSGVNSAWMLQTYGTINPAADAEPKETWGDRLDWARELLQTPLLERQAKIDQKTAASGQRVEFLGTGLHGSEAMGYNIVSNESKARSNPKTADDVRTIIMSSLGSVEDAERALAVVGAWIVEHPEDGLEIGMDAECLHMLIAAQEPGAGAKADFTPSLHPRDSQGRFAETAGGGETTPENYRDTWRPEMTPEEGHAWAEAAGTKIPQTVVHMTSKKAADGIKGTGFNTSSHEVIHEGGRYFAVDPETAEFYEYKGSTAVSVVVVAKNTLVLDWREPENMSDEARYGEFRGAALKAAGYNPDVVIYDKDLSEFHAADDPDDTTTLLKKAGYDSVRIYAYSGAGADPTVGGDQLIVFDREQAVTIGTETVPSPYEDPTTYRGFLSETDQALFPEEPVQDAPREEWERYWDAVNAWTNMHPDPRDIALERAFAKFNPDQIRDRLGRWAEQGEGVVAGGGGSVSRITAGATDAGYDGNELMAAAFSEVIRQPGSEVPGEHFGSEAEQAIAAKTRNINEIGPALADRAKDDPELKAQLDQVGNQYLQINREFERDLSTDGTPIEGTPYMREHLHYTPGMSATEVGGREIAAKLQDTWMDSASDSNPMSWGMQLALADRFGDPDAALEELRNSEDSKDFQWSGYVPGGPNTLEGAAREYADTPAVKAYVDEVYNRTQKILADAGVHEITIYRGVHLAHKYRLREGRQAVATNPTASFTLDRNTAEVFARTDKFTENQYVLTATVPADRVFAVPMTGPGCLKETELLVLGGPSVPVDVEAM